MATNDDPTWTALRLHPRDNVATALRDLAEGAAPRLPDCDAPILRNAIARGHKFALEAIATGSHATKYGQEIGVAMTDIAPGEHVHLHNVEGLSGQAERRRGRA